MTANRRIFVNIIATYGRTLYSIAIGLFSARWVLQALGASDYGLYGVVGGLTVFIGFFNSMLAAAVGRFYAYSVGAMRSAEDKDDAIAECRKWFNTALCIHTTIPLLLMVIGYPIGVWAIKNWLEIDLARISEAIWVFRFACIVCLVAMANVPFSAMYTAKQYIAELTLYGIVQTTLNFFFYYYMITHPGDWLVRYAFWGCILAIVPQLLICARALMVFPECTIRFEYFFSMDRFKRLGAFAGWQMFSGIGTTLSGQGMQILINKYFGTTINASMSVAGNVNGHAQSLSAALQGAFTPAITQACGAGDMQQMKSLSFRACKFSMLLSLLFVIPLSVEIDNLMVLWLKTPPPFVSGLCLCMMLTMLAGKSSVGHMIALNANGRIAAYQTFLGTAMILTLPIAWVFIKFGWGAYAVGYASIATAIFCAIGRVWFAKRLVGMSVSYWVLKIIVPISILTALSSLVAMLPKLFMAPSFLRLLISGIVVEIVFLPLVWFIALDCEERRFVVEHIRSIYGKVCGK